MRELQAGLKELIEELISQKGFNLNLRKDVYKIYGEEERLRASYKQCHLDSKIINKIYFSELANNEEGELTFTDRTNYKGRIMIIRY